MCLVYIRRAIEFDLFSGQHIFRTHNTLHHYPTTHHPRPILKTSHNIFGENGQSHSCFAVWSIADHFRNVQSCGQTEAACQYSLFALFGFRYFWVWTISSTMEDAKKTMLRHISLRSSYLGGKYFVHQPRATMINDRIFSIFL